jgi:hypothetical protein
MVIWWNTSSLCSDVSLVLLSAFIDRYWQLVVLTCPLLNACNSVFRWPWFAYNRILPFGEYLQGHNTLWSAKPFHFSSRSLLYAHTAGNYVHIAFMQDPPDKACKGTLFGIAPTLPMPYNPLTPCSLHGALLLTPCSIFPRSQLTLAHGSLAGALT